MNKKKLFALLLLTMTSLTALAQLPNTDDYEDLQEPAVSINNWIPVLICVSIIFAFYQIRKLNKKIA